MKNDITIELILEKVCEHFNLSIDDVKSKRKYGNLPLARQIYFYISRKITDNKLEYIGKIVNKEHSLVIFSVRKIEEQKLLYPEIEKYIQDIYNLIYVYPLFCSNIIIQDIDLLAMANNNMLNI